MLFSTRIRHYFLRNKQKCGWTETHPPFTIIKFVQQFPLTKQPTNKQTQATTYSSQLQCCELHGIKFHFFFTLLNVPFLQSLQNVEQPECRTYIASMQTVQISCPSRTQFKIIPFLCLICVMAWVFSLVQLFTVFFFFVMS